MEHAYKVAAKLGRALIERDRPDDARRLLETQVVVVRGEYDRGESIFSLCEIGHTAIAPADVARVGLDPDQILFVNCPGNLPERGLAKVRSFVEQGGMLVTTDWALRHVIERAFPGYVAYNGRATADDVVRVVFEQGVGDGLLDGLLDPQDDPLWWLEGSSYPIRVLHPSVKVLVSSAEMQGKYGEAPIVVTWEVGQGKVYHLTSHFYLQRTETRTQRHRVGATDYVAQKRAALSSFTADELQSMSASCLTEVQSAYTSARSVQNMCIEQSKRVAKRKGLA